MTTERGATLQRLLDEYGELEVEAKLPVVYWIECLDKIFATDRELGQDILQSFIDGLTQSLQFDSLKT